LVTLREARFINLDNVLTVAREGDLTTVVMVGGEKVYADTMPETLIGAVTPAGSCTGCTLRLSVRRSRAAADPIGPTSTRSASESAIRQLPPTFVGCHPII
jgi:hypothetical protein